MTLNWLSSHADDQHIRPVHMVPLVEMKFQCQLLTLFIALGKVAHFNTHNDYLTILSFFFTISKKKHCFKLVVLTIQSVLAAVLVNLNYIIFFLVPLDVLKE